MQTNDELSIIANSLTDAIRAKVPDFSEEELNTMLAAFYSGAHAACCLIITGSTTERLMSLCQEAALDSIKAIDRRIADQN